MEPTLKRGKTHGFETDEEAAKEAQRVVELDRNMWEKIILENKQLSVRDIERMCSVNRIFRKFCQEREIWKKIYDSESSPQRQRDIVAAIKIFYRNDKSFEKDYMRLVFLNRILSHPQVHIENQTVTHEWVFLLKAEPAHQEWKTTITYTYTIAQYQDEGYPLEIFHENGNVDIDFRARTLHDEFVTIGQFLWYDDVIDWTRRVTEDYFEFDIDEDFHQSGFSVNTGHHTTGEKNRSERFLIALFYIFAIQEEFNPVETPTMHLLQAQVCSNISCRNKGKTLCGLCKDTLYCSQECANRDWPRHNCRH